MDSMRRTPNRLRLAIDAWADYEQRFPEFKQRSIPIALDEWTSSRTNLAPGGSMFSALTAAETLNEMFRFSKLFLMSVYTGATGCLAISKTDSVIQANGLMFKMYREHFGTIPVAVSGNSPQHPVKGTVGVDVPRVMSGSETYPLDVAAALTADKKALTIAVVNPSGTAQEAQVNVTGVALRGTGRVWRIAAPSITTRNEVGKPAAVAITETPVNEALTRVAVPPLSISVYVFAVQ
jgi:alpha-N-arabinofuranosidase